MKLKVVKTEIVRIVTDNPGDAGKRFQGEAVPLT